MFEHLKMKTEVDCIYSYKFLYSNAAWGTYLSTSTIFFWSSNLLANKISKIWTFVTNGSKKVEIRLFFSSICLLQNKSTINYWKLKLQLSYYKSVAMIQTKMKRKSNFLKKGSKARNRWDMQNMHFQEPKWALNTYMFSKNMSWNLK